MKSSRLPKKNKLVQSSGSEGAVWIMIFQESDSTWHRRLVRHAWAVFCFNLKLASLLSEAFLVIELVETSRFGQVILNIDHRIILSLFFLVVIILAFLASLNWSQTLLSVVSRPGRRRDRRG